MLMCVQNVVKFCPLVPKILSGNENYEGITELRNDRITELQKDRQGKSSINLVKFCPLVLKILSGNEILTSIKGHNSVANLRNLTLNNPNLDTINVNVCKKCG